MNKKTTEYQSRYVAYASSQGNTPEKQIHLDSQVYPGGKMAGYICWITTMWGKWADESRQTKAWGSAWSSEQHKAFDAWLSA